MRAYRPFEFGGAPKLRTVNEYITGSKVCMVPGCSNPARDEHQRCHRCDKRLYRARKKAREQLA